jgi:putative tricarboxylic transport membrane protein
MDSTLQQLGAGFAQALTMTNLLWCAAGVTLGTAVGVLPGIGPAITISLLLPMVSKLEPASALIMFTGIYFGAMYGGSTTSILLNTPGESATIVTALEGNKMAKRGRAGAALATAAIGSFVAGTITVVLLAFFAPLIADLALKFWAHDMFALCVLAFATVGVVLGKSMLRGLTALAIGLFIGAMGIDKQTGQARFTFGQVPLLDGIDVTVVAIGLFAVGEALFVASYMGRVKDEVSAVTGSLMMTAKEWKRSIMPWLRGTFIGFPMGAMPAGGAEVPTFLSYATERKLTKHPEEFGNGAIEGVAGPEAANNASASGTLVPLLTLGLPTNATAAIMLAAFIQLGMQPGPMLMTTSGDIVWALIASLFIGNVMLLILNLPLIGVWVKLLSIPRHYLYAGILLFATLSAYSIRNSWVDLFILAIIGVMGFVMRRFNFPLAPVIVGMILGPRAEEHLRKALAISEGRWMDLVTRPISGTILAVTLLLLVAPPIYRALKKQ